VLKTKRSLNYMLANYFKLRIGSYMILRGFYVENKRTINH